MVDRKVVLRYARALFALAQERGLVDEVARDLTTLAASFEESPELVTFLADPLVPPTRKQAVAARWFDGRVSKQVLDFIDLVLTRGRDGVLFDVSAVFMELVREATGIVRAHVESVIELDEPLRGNLEAKLQEMTGKHVELSRSLNPALLGGLRVTVGNNLFDGSLLRRLEDLRHHLLEADAPS